MEDKINILRNINTHKKDYNIEFEIFCSLKQLFSHPTSKNKKQIIHKINRIFFEFEFIENNEEKFHSLTDREKEIINLLVKGNDNPSIANMLFISRYTVEQHRKNINRKLGINSIVQLYAFAYAFNLA